MHRRDWGLAYLQQARADFDIFLRLQQDPNMLACHVLLFLQMATEKLAKAALLLGECVPLEEVNCTHAVFVQMLRHFQRHAGIAKLLAFDGKGRGNTESLSKHIQSLLPTARWIEQLAPASSHNTNAEYPWLHAQGAVISPSIYPFAEWSPSQNPKQRQILSLVAQLLDNAVQIFE